MTEQIQSPGDESAGRPSVERSRGRSVIRVLKEGLSSFRKYAFSNGLSSFGTILVIAFLILALAYPLTNGAIAPYNPNAQNLFNGNAPPSLAHWFGTDIQGRDIFSRVLAAIPIDIGIPLFIVFLSAIIGIVFGMIAGYLGGYVEEAIMRVCDLFLAFPVIIMALVIAATLGPSLINASLALTFVWWPPYVRLVRGGVLAVKSEDYIATSKALNSSFFYIMRKGLFPNILPAILVYASLDVGTALLSVSSLGFLGVGIPPDQPELGAMVGALTQNGSLFIYPWQAILPSVVVLLIVLGFSLFGDGIREASDVRVRPHVLLRNRLIGGGLNKEDQPAAKVPPGKIDPTV
jgi:peptide/nickel transport system permease protein